MALFDSGDKYWDSPLGGNDKTNAIPQGTARFLSGLFHVLCRVAFRYEIKNVQVVRAFKGKKTGAVIVAPHVSYVDAVIMYLSVRPEQWVRMLARDGLFEKASGLLGAIISRAGAIPVKRDSADRTVIKRASKALKNGELVGIFPEGTRRGKGNVETALHGGAALIARMGKAPLIPMGIKNVELVKQKGKRFRFPKITAVFGNPVALSSFDFIEKSERLNAATWYVMRESFALSRGCAPEEVNMRELFPDSTDFTDAFAQVEIPAFSTESLTDYVPEGKE